MPGIISGSVPGSPQHRSPHRPSGPKTKPPSRLTIKPAAFVPQTTQAQRQKIILLQDEGEDESRLKNEIQEQRRSAGEGDGNYSGSSGSGKGKGKARMLPAPRPLPRSPPEIASSLAAASSSAPMIDGPASSASSSATTSRSALPTIPGLAITAATSIPSAPSTSRTSTPTSTSTVRSSSTDSVASNSTSTSYATTIAGASSASYNGNSNMNTPMTTASSSSSTSTIPTMSISTVGESSDALQQHHRHRAATLQARPTHLQNTGRSTSSSNVNLLRPLASSSGMGTRERNSSLSAYPGRESPLGEEGVVASATLMLKEVDRWLVHINERMKLLETRHRMRLDGFSGSGPSELVELR